MFCVFVPKARFSPGGTKSNFYFNYVNNEVLKCEKQIVKMIIKFAQKKLILNFYIYIRVSIWF